MRAVAVDVERVGVAAAHGAEPDDVAIAPASPSPDVELLRLLKIAKIPSPMPKVTATPMMPASPVDSPRRRRPSRRSRRGDRRRSRAAAPASANPSSIATLLSPSGELLAYGLTKKASTRATTRPPTINAHRLATSHRHRHDLPTTADPSCSSSDGQQIVRAVHQVGTHAQHDADRERGDETLADPDQEVGTPTIAANTVPTEPVRCRRSRTRSRTRCEARTTDSRAAIPEAATTDPRVAGSNVRIARKMSVAAVGGHERHVDDVQPERGQSAVGEQQRLDERARRRRRAAPAYGPTRIAARAAAQQVTTRARGDGEVQHLDGEDEGSDEARHAGRAFSERVCFAL